MNGRELLISCIDRELALMEELPVIKGYALVIGGGKVGTRFIKNTSHERYPLVLTIDIDPEAEASGISEVIEDQKKLSSILKQKIGILEINEHRSPKNGISLKRNYFYSCDIGIIKYILSHGIPECIVPAVPVHIAAQLIADIMTFPLKYQQDAEVFRTSVSSIPVHEFTVLDQYPVRKIFFDNFVSNLPEHIILSQYPEKGIIVLSYTKGNEICPDHCPGHSGYCPFFEREKARDTIDYLRNLKSFYTGWVFESYQIGAGLGGISGNDVKKNLLDALKYVRNIYVMGNERDSDGNMGHVFFVGTSCKCHGILNLFYLNNTNITDIGSYR